MSAVRHAPALAALIGAERRKQRGALAVAALCAAILSVSGVALLGLSGWFITAAALAGGAGGAYAFNYVLPAAGIRLFAILRTGGRYGERLASHEAALHALAAIRPALFAALARAPAGEALALSTGEASARLVQDVDQIESLFVRRSARWGAAAALASGAGLAALAGPAAGVATAAFFALTIAGAHRIARTVGAPAGPAAQRAAGRLKDVYASLAAAAPELACHGLQAWAADRVALESAALCAAKAAAARAQGWQGAWTALMTAAAAATALLLARPGHLALAAVAALAAAACIDGAAALARGFDADAALEEAARRLDPLLAAGAARATPHSAGAHCPGFAGASPRGGRERKQRPAPEPLSPSWGEYGRRPGGGLQRSATSAAIDAADPLTVVPGERLIIVGRSGCGKTTVVEQMLKLRDARPGRIVIDGVDIDDMSTSQARALFAYAPQDAALTSGTARETLRQGASDADEAALWVALADAGLDARVRGLPGGLDAWLGDAGERLSGGERRRLSLARAYLRPAPWLLLDEPTEGLDGATEAFVVERLRARLARTGQGLIAVTHRPAVLALGDRAVRLDELDPARADARPSHWTLVA